jgi:hypothetical protein
VKNKSHLRFLEEAERAADKLHTDTSVSKAETKDSLEQLRDHINTLIEAVTEDGHEEAE